MDDVEHILKVSLQSEELGMNPPHKFVPNEIWAHIFNYIGDVADIVVLIETCHKFRAIIHANVTQLIFTNKEHAYINSKFLHNFSALIECPYAIFVTDSDHMVNLIHLRVAHFQPSNKVEEDWLVPWFQHWIAHRGLLRRNHNLYLSQGYMFYENGSIKLEGTANDQLVKFIHQHGLIDFMRAWQEINLLYFVLERDNLTLILSSFTFIKRIEITQGAIIRLFQNIDLLNKTSVDRIVCIPEELTGRKKKGFKLTLFQRLLKEELLKIISKSRVNMWDGEDELNARAIAILIPLTRANLQLLIKIFPLLSEAMLIFPIIVADKTTFPNIILHTLN